MLSTHHGIVYNSIQKQVQSMWTDIEPEAEYMLNNKQKLKTVCSPVPLIICTQIHHDDV